MTIREDFNPNKRQVHKKAEHCVPGFVMRNGAELCCLICRPVYHPALRTRLLRASGGWRWLLSPCHAQHPT
jgi:hypothetical protein